MWGVVEWIQQRLVLEQVFGLGGSARVSWSSRWVGPSGCACGDKCTFAHSWAELHPEASAHEHELASYFNA